MDRQGPAQRHCRKTLAEEREPHWAGGFDSPPPHPQPLKFTLGTREYQQGTQRWRQRRGGEGAETDKDRRRVVCEGPLVPGSRV